MCDYAGEKRGEHLFVSRLTGDETRVRVRRRVVDATYLETPIPATHVPSFDIDPGARFIPVNDLVTVSEPARGYTVIGAGKTAMDACYWLIDNGVDPAAIRWIRPRDAWVNDRAAIQPLRLVAGFVQWLAAMNEASATASTIDDLYRRMESAGALVRLDPDVEPAFYRAAILSESEREVLRGIEQVVRLGRVRNIGATSIELDEGSIPTKPGHVHVDCTAAGLSCGPNRAVFEPHRITPQWLQNGIAPFNAALVGWVEANRDDDRARNALCVPNGFAPEAGARNLARQWARTQRAIARWSSEPDLGQWLSTCRLSPFGNAAEHLAGPAMDAVMRMLQHRAAAIENLDRLLAAG
jgi:hypothetical protein